MTEQETKNEVERDLSETVETVLDIGRLWASHGLRIGRGALETSARTLEATATVLSDLATKLEPKKG